MRARFQEMLQGWRPDERSPWDLRIQKAIFLARRLQERASELQTPQERRQQAELDRMIQSPLEKATLAQITDQAFRSVSAARVVDQLTHILDVQGIPRFFSPIDRALLKGFQSFGNYLPGVAVPLVRDKMHRETANVILPAERELLAEHLQQRRGEGLRMNVNLLGESLLGEEDAEERLKTYLSVLQRPEIEVISVKISTLYSQISPIARAHTLDVLGDRLELLFRASARSRYERADGTLVPKFVYLDMEEYRDMTLTAEAFMEALGRPGLERVSAGIALQAYIPDSYLVLQDLLQWARGRVGRGGAPITIRLVKGANMEMERVDASLHDWPQAPYSTKIETDANYKRMILAVLNDDYRHAVRLGIASHNLFDVALGLVLTDEAEAWNRVQFEMLEGMANHQRRALFELAKDVLLYAPACRQEEFIYAIGYLVRRLDENTGPENFLRHAFRLKVGSDDWQRLEASFVEAWEKKDAVLAAPRRKQDRRSLVLPDADDRHEGLDQGLRSERSEGASDDGERRASDWRGFRNEPDTDFSLRQNAEWAVELARYWEKETRERPRDVPLVIDGRDEHDSHTGRECRPCHDPSRPGVTTGRYVQANSEDIERAVRCAREDADGWRRRSVGERSRILAAVAQEMRVRRAELIGIAMADGAKTIAEADPEVSEAIDFLEFYRRAAEMFTELPGVHARGAGVVVVVSPWNFPIAIPCGGIAAALAAGNTVILKPASDTVLTAYHLCECFWRAGVSRKVLQFVPCAGAVEGQQLVAHDDVDVVILTGGTETAQTMLRHKPTMRLFAETGGKNATIVTSLADRDQAIKNVVHSAFSHCGQKCSATSLLILESEVYDDPAFRRTLVDAVKSLPVGSVWELQNRLGPLIRVPRGVLETALKELEPGESWALMPGEVDQNPQMITPGIKWDVQPGSATHRTEFFGPVLGVMRAENLRQAVDFVHQTGYGLTSGLESLDDREQKWWIDAVQAGNLYVNRTTTGAVVMRQPFGGVAKSTFGPGIKAGGPNYVAQLMAFEELPLVDENRSLEYETARDMKLSAEMTPFAERLQKALRDRHWVDDLPPDEVKQVLRSLTSYQAAMDEEYGRVQDSFRLLGQDNFRRYRPVRSLRVRIHPEDTWFETLARIAAARTVGCRVTVSLPLRYSARRESILEELTESWAASVEFVEESDDALVDVIALRHADRIRYARPQRVPVRVRQAVIEPCLYVADQPVRRNGRLELMWYVQEQSVCVNYHRYGNLGTRAATELPTQHAPGSPRGV